jgi:hypothetical protein
MTTAAAGVRPTPPLAALGRERIKVYQHSDLIYWWVVWAYGYFCAFLTYLQGRPVVLSDDGRKVLFHPSAWLGISFVALALFVLIFTNARARGVKSLVLFLVLLVIGFGVQILQGWDGLLSYFPLLLVYMNQAFYVLFSSVLLLAWLFTVLFSDRLTYWEFAPGLISRRQRFSEGGESFATPHLQTRRQSDDIFVHRVLGLWFLGFGTGDLDIQFSVPSGERHYHLQNVWRVGAVEREINRLVAKQGPALR